MPNLAEVKINDKFTAIRPDRYGWRLEERTVGKSRKDGSPSESTIVTYHPSLLACVNKVMDLDVGMHDDLESLKEHYNHIRESICTCLEEQSGYNDG